MHLLEEEIKGTVFFQAKKKLRYLLFVILFCFINPHASFSANELSPAAKISILTCGPGESLYAAFGHTAILVDDPVNKIDEVYNYGTFDVSTSNFYIKFLTGRLDYALAISDINGFLEEYDAENRWVFEQELLVSNEIKQRIYDSLKVVSRSENRYYRYDFFRNNCSTKVIDLILAFSANKTMLDSLKTASGKTFREALKPYIAGREWLNLGINMLLGPFADQPMSKLQSTYLPENLMHVIGETGLSSIPKEILTIGYEPPVKKDPDLPTILFWVLAMALIFEALWAKSSVTLTNRIDAVLFALSGIFGLLFIFFWVWSDHVSLHLNLNLFWANPLNLILALAILRGNKRFTKIWSIIYALLVFFLLINWSRLPQTFPLELMPVATALAFRAINRVFDFKSKDKMLAPKTNDLV